MAKLNSAVVAGGGVEILSALVAGVAANTTLAIAALRPDAQLVEVTAHSAAAAPVSKLTGATVNAAGGGIKVTSDTTGDVVRVIYVQAVK